MEETTMTNEESEEAAAYMSARKEALDRLMAHTCDAPGVCSNAPSLASLGLTMDMPDIGERLRALLCAEARALSDQRDKLTGDLEAGKFKQSRNAQT